MEERVKELEKKVDLMSRHIVELTKIQANLIKTINRQSKLLDEISKNDMLQSLTIEEIVKSLDV